MYQVQSNRGSFCKSASQIDPSHLQGAFEGGGDDVRQDDVQDADFLAEPVDDPPAGVGVEEAHGQTEHAVKNAVVNPDSRPHASSPDQERSHVVEKSCGV